MAAERVRADADAAPVGGAAAGEDVHESMLDTSLGDTVDGGDAELSRPKSDPDQIARFVVLGRLGAGGMGVVFAAWDPQLERRVALKLVRPGSKTADAQERLLREAQAMARLNHPNVVSVYEVGRHRGGVWIAMEFVEGETLRELLLELGALASSRNRSSGRGEGSVAVDSGAQGAGAEPPWRQVLALFQQAGEGLAAAHAAGLIHRDFKPDNVLIGHDGRARVADFGLVRPRDEDSEVRARSSSSGVRSQARQGTDRFKHLMSREPDEELMDGDTVEGSGLPELLGAAPNLVTPSSALAGQLTADGALLGTPRYMSPEQFRRMPAGARSDQFSFCIALYRALYGVWPFEGKEFFELAAAVTLSDAEPVPTGSPVPAKIGQAIMRGLSRSPGDRFSSMEELLVELRPPEPRRRRWPWLLGSLGGAALAAGVALGLAGSPEAIDVCAKGRAQSVQTWGEGRRELLRDRFEQEGPSFAAASLTAVDTALSSWAESWGSTYAETCAARHEQSAEGYELRMACLAEQREQVEGLLAQLVEADAELVSQAPERVMELPEASRCAELRARGLAEPPSPEQREGVRRARGALARARGRLDAGRKAGVQGELALAEELSEQLDYPPLAAELEVARGSVFTVGVGEREEARAHALRGHEQALASGHDRVALRAATLLITIDDAGPGDRGLEFARRWSAVASGLTQRLGSQPQDELAWRLELGVAYSRQMHYEAALSELSKVETLAREIYEPEDLRLAKIQTAFAMALAGDGRLDEAAERFTQAIAVYERKLGPTHPLLITPLFTRAQHSSAAGEFEAALRDGERALAIGEQAYGPNSAKALNFLTRVAVYNDLLGDHEGALAKFEAVLERTGESEAITTRMGLRTSNSQCFALYQLGRYEEAHRVCERTVAAAPGIAGPEHPMIGVMLNNLGLLARAEGDYELSLVHDRRALELCDATLGDHVYTAYSLIGIGEAQIARGRFGEAISMLERALKIRLEAADPGEVGEAECLLARALAGNRTPKPDSRAAELQQSGLARLREAGRNWAKHAETCAAL